MTPEREAEQLALLEGLGFAPARARALAAELGAGAPSGTVYGGLTSPDLSRIWERATFTGVRRMRLEIEASAATLEEDEGTLTVRVLETERWAEWGAQHEAAASGMAALLLGWEEEEDRTDQDTN